MVLSVFEHKPKHPVTETSTGKFHLLETRIAIQRNFY